MSNKTKSEPVLEIALLSQFSTIEINLLFSIISLAKDGTNGVINISFDDLEELSDYKRSALKLFIKDLEHSYDKLMALEFSTRDANELVVEKFKMFTGFKINADLAEPNVEIQAHEKALPLVESFDQEALNSLQEFRRLNSSYSKTMFRLLKQVSNVGKIYFSKEDFTKQLVIPNSYKQGDIDRTILGPITEELTPIFKGLTIKKEYGSGRGHPVVGYQFTFDWDNR